MGYSLCWLAIKGKPPQVVREVLGFHPTGERESISESPISAVEMPNGWYVIVCDHVEHVATDAMLQQLSAGCEIVTCFIEEHVMVSAATGWGDGKQLWAVTHDSQKDRRHLDVKGQPPEAFAEIRSTWLAKYTVERQCDFTFEIPVETARSVTGYRNDRDVDGLSGDVYEVLDGKVPAGQIETPKRSWFRKFLGQ